MKDYDSIYDLFEEYDSNIIRVTDFDIRYRGSRVDNIALEEDVIKIYAGNPEDENGYFEELLPSKEEKRLILEEILENFS